jgi:hypothetical protein
MQREIGESDYVFSVMEVPLWFYNVRITLGVLK